MQSASSNFTQEISGGSVVWAPPRVFADWDRTGYLADGSIDDLSAQVGDSFTIAHHLDDGLPEQVTFVSGLGSPTLDTPLVAGRVDGLPANRRASTYFSPFNTTSPVSGFDRDVAPVKLDWGVVTAAGQEYVRLFTGQMSNIPVAGQEATLQAMSATRLKLSKLIQPPAIIGDDRGLNATWCVSYALAQAGLYLSPPPRSQCRAWYPMHGSFQAVIPDMNGRPDLATDPPGGNLFMYEKTAPTWSPPPPQIRPVFTASAPYLMAASTAVDTSKVRYVQGSVSLGPGADIFSKANSSGRIEMWVKGDALNFNAAPGGSGGYSSLNLVQFEVKVGPPPGVGEFVPSIKFGVQPDRKVFMYIQDGTTLWTVATLAPLPTDGNWYFIGAAWNLNPGAPYAVAIRELNSTTSFYSAGPVNTKLPATDNINLGFPKLEAYLPIAELQIATGVDVGGAFGPWVSEIAWTLGAVVRPSILELSALAETKPREIWELLGSLAQAELATMRADELDRFCYLPMSYWAEPAQQAVVDAYSTSLNMADISVDADPSKIRNSVSVDYSDTRIDPTFANVLEVNETRVIPTGVSTLKMALNKPAVNIFRGPLIAATGADVAAGIGNGYTANSSRDGTGTYLGSPSVTVSVTDWNPGSVTLSVNNTTGSVAYFANNGSGVPTITVHGSAVNVGSVSAVATDPTSIARRGERGLSVSLPAIQRLENALAIARELAARLMKPRPVIHEVSLFPDPRRQPGDLVTLTDAVNTGASGLWRTQSITHTRSGSDYTQTATVRRAMPVAIEGVATEGDYTAGP